MFWEKHDLFNAHFFRETQIMAQLKLVNFAKVLKKAQEPGNDLTDCSPDVNFKVYKEASQLI